jgi:hypothetical protein
MAPKLRSKKSPGQPVTASNHSGAAPDGAQSHGTAPAPVPASPVPASPEPAVPTGESLADDAGTSADAAEGDRSPSFWDWAPAEDAAELDDPQDGFARIDAADGAPPPAAAAEPPKATWKLVVTPVEPAGGGPQRPGIGQRWGNLLHLSANPRMRGWQRRAIIAIIIGVVFAVLVSWRLGLTLAVVAAIADTIYQSKRGVPGRRVKVTGAMRKTRRQLAKLERAGYRAMNGNLIPDSEEQIDHLVVGPAGVFAIDSESWNKHLVVRTKNGLQLWHGPVSMKDRLEHARWESEQAAEMLSAALGSPVIVRPAMAVYGPKIPWDVATIREVDVFSGPRLVKYLRRRARHSGERPLSEAEVERIYKAAHQAFPHLAPGVPVS